MEQKELENLFDRLNTAILQQEERLKNLCPVCPVSVSISPFYSLHFEKYRTLGWKLTLRMNSSEDGRMSLLTSVPIDLRVEAAKYIPAIEMEILKTKEAFLKDLHSVLGILENAPSSSSNSWNFRKEAAR